MFSHRIAPTAFVMILAFAGAASGQTVKQPKVQPGPSEPDLLVLLDRLYRLRMFDDLLNPVVTTPEATPGLFRKSGPGPVTFTPILALGLDVTIRGGPGESFLLLRSPAVVTEFTGDGLRLGPVRVRLRRFNARRQCPRFRVPVLQPGREVAVVRVAGANPAQQWRPIGGEHGQAR